MLYLGNPEYGVDLAPIDFVKFAEVCGARGVHIDDPKHRRERLRQGLAIDAPALIECVVDPLEITAPVAAMMIVAFLAHEATALWDVSYAVTARNVTPIEQHVHSFLEMVPLMAISFIAVLHWPQFRVLAGLGGEPADFSLRAKDTPLPPGYIPTLLAATGIFELLPYLEELYRTLRVNNLRLVPADRPASNN